MGWPKPEHQEQKYVECGGDGWQKASPWHLSPLLSSKKKRLQTCARRLPAPLLLLAAPLLLRFLRVSWHMRLIACNTTLHFLSMATPEAPWHGHAYLENAKLMMLLFGKLSGVRKLRLAPD